MLVYEVDEAFATVGALEDIDGDWPRIVLNPDRRHGDDGLELIMEPRVARALARRLNRWAKLASS